MGLARLQVAGGGLDRLSGVGEQWRGRVRGEHLRSEVMSWELGPCPCGCRHARGDQNTCLVTSGPWTVLLCMRVHAGTWPRGAQLLFMATLLIPF